MVKATHVLRTSTSSFIIIFSFHEHYLARMLANDHSKMPISGIVNVFPATAEILCR